MKKWFELLSFTLCIDGVEVDAKQFDLRCLEECADACVYAGAWNGLRLRIDLNAEFGMTGFFATLEKDRPVGCTWIRADLIWKAEGLRDALVPSGGKDVFIAGMHRLTEVPTPEDSRYCGFFCGSQESCLLLGTKIPQDNLHLYQARLLDDDTAIFSAKTYFTTGQSQMCSVRTETTLICEGLTPLAAMERYASHVPMLPETQFAEPLVGWSTWDYYFTAITPADLTENLNAISADPELREKMKCFMIDDGWQYREGEWFANYRFPQGTKGIAEEIRAHGLIPGIWTNGCQTHFLTHTALRHGEMLLRNASGDAISVDGLFLIDPTHPAGEAYIYETYRRLYEDGFRIFKVDFVSTLTAGDNFYDKACGPYEAIRRLFRIIRRAVGEESHILGCSYPGECGPGLVNSRRISVDIHNHWSHVKWILDYWQSTFWENGRICRVDPDYLVVRGSDTSTESETNVTNPSSGSLEGGSRWRRGPVFDLCEAETWANIVTFVGGNIVSSDRLIALNEAGMTLLKRHLLPGSGAIPLDLGDQERAAFWYAAKEKKLLVINHADDAREVCFSFGRFGISVGNVVCDKPFRLEDDLLKIELKRHESAVVRLYCGKRGES